MIDLAAIKAQAAITPELVLPTTANTQHLGGSMKSGIGDPYTYYPNLWAWLRGLLNAQSVQDIGCGHGYAVDFFEQLGVDAWGVDGDAEAVKSAICGHPVLCYDFSIGPWKAPSRQFDLIWCCEFLEHLDEQHLDNVFAAFGYGKTIVITHATPGQGGHHHVNEQLSGYWILQFMKRGFVLDENLTACARIVAAADKHLLNLAHDSYFMKTGLVFHNPNV